MPNPTLTWLLLAWLPVPQAPAPSPPAKATAADVAWLTGCWELTRGPRHVVEHWMAPEGGLLLGLSRTVTNGKATEYEFVMIREREDGGLEYIAKPSRQAEATFTASTVTKEEVVFENPQHDFPQRILYRKQADGGLTARIEGTVNGATRGIDFPYRPAACAP